MVARVFISYRATDGADKATALARDLGRLFGDAQVFIDKDDLSAGVQWAEEVSRVLDARPVMLLLLTPALLEVSPANGKRPLDDPQGPVRRELMAALAAGAVVVPVLCDGVDTLPAGLPPPLDALGERTWRRLRAYDWPSDLRRLATDLRAHGLQPVGRPQARRTVLAVAALLGVGAGAAWWWARPPADPLSGRWVARVGDEPAVTLRLTLEDGRGKAEQGPGARPEGEPLAGSQTILMESEPIDIRQRPEWTAYRAFWRESGGQDLDAVRWRGQGTARAAAGSALAIDIGFKVLAVPGGQEVDGGNLSAVLQPDGRLKGTRWLNGAQAERPALLERTSP
jgi:hypothetical protein